MVNHDMLSAYRQYATKKSQFFEQSHLFKENFGEKLFFFFRSTGPSGCADSLMNFAKAMGVSTCEAMVSFGI